MNGLKSLIASTFVTASLVGCTVVPGSDMGRANSVWFDDTPEEYLPASTDISYIPINATVLSNQAQTTELTVPQKNEALQSAMNNYTYAIGVGDILNITVWEHPELTIPSGSFRSPSEGGNEVKADGTIFYPYAGDIQVVGLTTKEVKALIVENLSSVIKSPQVDVRVADYRSKKVFVSGAVKQPSVLPITNTPLTLVEAIDRAGGLAPDAAWNNVQLTRNGTTSYISLKSLYQEGAWSKNLLLQQNDLLHIPRNDADKIFVLGEVRRPSSISMSRNGTSLAEALSEANGINERTADGRGIYVLRNTAIVKDSDGLPVYKATVFHLNANSAVGFMLADKFSLKPRDVVYVAPAPIAKWNRFLSQLLPSLLATDRVGDIEAN